MSLRACARDPPAGARFRKGGEDSRADDERSCRDFRAQAGRQISSRRDRATTTESVLLRERFTCDDGAPLGDLGATRELKPTATPLPFPLPLAGDHRASSERRLLHARPYLRLCTSSSLSLFLYSVTHPLALRCRHRLTKSPIVNIRETCPLDKCGDGWRRNGPSSCCCFFLFPLRSTRYLPG